MLMPKYQAHTGYLAGSIRSCLWLSPEQTKPATGRKGHQDKTVSHALQNALDANLGYKEVSANSVSPVSVLPCVSQHYKMTSYKHI